MNPNPTKARQARRKKKAGSLKDAQVLLWRALERAGELLEVEDPAMSLKAVHAISQGTAAYARLTEVGELQERLAALEALSGAASLGSGPRLGQGSGSCLGQGSGPRLGQGAA